jgi:hypothetical protein
VCTSPKGPSPQTLPKFSGSAALLQVWRRIVRSRRGRIRGQPRAWRVPYLAHVVSSHRSPNRRTISSLSGCAQGGPMHGQWKACVIGVCPFSHARLPLRSQRDERILPEASPRLRFAAPLQVPGAASGPGWRASVKALVPRAVADAGPLDLPGVVRTGVEVIPDG